MSTTIWSHLGAPKKSITKILGRLQNVSSTRELLSMIWLAIRLRVRRFLGPHFFYWLAAFYRMGLPRVVFIGVTGSCGKTTTKELIAAVLSSQFKGQKNVGNGNLPHHIVKTVFRTRPWDKFCVQEITPAGHKGTIIPLERPLRLVKPQIGVVTNIGTDHLSAFGSMEAIAAAKGKLIAALPQKGTAILNADDANVLAMQARSTCRVMTYGLTPKAMVRAENVRCSWPEGLSFTLLCEDQSYHVQTQLCGTHWVSCVLAAFAVGLAMKIPISKMVEVVQTFLPFDGRMSPVRHPDGTTFILDDVKAPFWSIPPALRFMKEAKARRKIVVIGMISDFPGNQTRKYVSVARQALDVADHVLFVGPRASKCLKAKSHPKNHALQAFWTVEAASEYLRDLLQPGDLVLLKGSKKYLRGIIPVQRAEGEQRQQQSDS